MRKLASISLVGFALAMAQAVVPTEASAGTLCSSRWAGYFWWCQRGSVTIPRGEPAVPEPGAAALFGLGAALVAARSRAVRSR